MARTSLEKLEQLLSISAAEGIQVRREWLGGVRGGLVRVGHQPVLFVDDSIGITEQLEQLRATLMQLDWSETQWADAMHELLELPAEVID
jgi:hypothetical protein